MVVVESVGKSDGRIVIELSNITADDEESSVIDLHQLHGYPRNGSVSLQVSRSAGATDVVSFLLEMSNESAGGYATVASVTSVAGGISTIVFQADRVAKYAKIRVPTVGVGNTCKATAVIS